MSHPQLRGYPYDARLRDRDRSPVTTPLRHSVPAWFRRVTGAS